MSKGLFITGTGTDVGKTYVTALIVKKLHDAGLNTAYYKAAMSGNEYNSKGILVPGDAQYVKSISGITQNIDQMCPYVYEAAYSPHLASRLEGNPVEIDRVLEGFRSLSSHYDYITMEGSGGILCPLDFDGKKLWLWEMIKMLSLPCIVIADAGLGTINSVGLTVNFMKEKDIPVKGIIFNNYHPGNLMELDNIYMCEYLTGVKVIACIKENEPEILIDDKEIIELYEEIS